MRIDLSQLNTQELSLQLTPPETVREQQQFIQLHETSALSGVFVSDETSLQLSDTAADRVIIDALRMMFGSIVLSAEGRTEILKLTADYASRSGELDLGLSIGAMHCPKLSVEVSSILAVAAIALEQCRVEVTPEGGRIEVPKCVFREFSVTLGAIKLSAPELHVQDLVMSWSDEPFELHAREVTSNHFEFAVEGTTAAIYGLNAAQLDVKGSDWSIQEVRTESIELRIEAVEQAIETTTEDAAQATEDVAQAAEEVTGEELVPTDDTEHYKTKLPLFVWTLFDQLSGHINVDLGVDIKLPIFQHRRAVHQFRVPIKEGKLNYQALEQNLSTLENQLLDFSIRPGELVLELGIPLLPSRGFGKPLVRWPLSELEQREAESENHWVRLATLVQPQILVGQNSTEPKMLAEHNESSADNTTQAPGLALPQTDSSDADQDQDEGDDESASALRQLTMRNIDLQLSLLKPATPYDGALLKTLEIGSLVARGDVVHRTKGEAEQTRAYGSISDVLLSVDDFPLVGRKFDLNQVLLSGESRFELQLENLKLLACTVQLGPISAKSIDFGVFAEGSVD